MPLTFCHPAIVLPFKAFPKKWFSMVGLITGSMIPDFEYFLTMQVDSGIAHTIPGIFLFDVPLSIIAAYVFFNIIAKDFINNLPLYFKSRLLFITQINWNTYFRENWYIVIYSIIIGSVSHLFLDAFTHADGFFVLKFPVLTHKISAFSQVRAIYNILQHTGTLIGGLIVLIYISKLNPATTINQINSKAYWIKVIIITSIIVLLRIGIGGFGKSVIITLIVSTIAAGLYALLLTSLLFRKKVAEKSV